MDKIREIFADKSIVCGGRITVYYQNRAIEVIEKCKELSIRFWGLNAFVICGKGIQPFMEFSPDYSNIPNEEACDKGIEFIKIHQDKALLYEVVYEGY